MTKLNSTSVCYKYSLAYLNIDDKRKQGDELRRQITELDMIREQYNILKKEYEVCD